jgi:hypothetical protein
MSTVPHDATPATNRPDTPKRFVFADEAGNFDFSRQLGATRYFVLTTVTMDNCGVGDALLALRIDATILEKAKAQPQLATDPEAFYRRAWHEHFHRVAVDLSQDGHDLQIVAASLGTRRRRAQFQQAVAEVAMQVTPAGVRKRVSAWSAASDPCLQVADYCCWAIQRKWERLDWRPYAPIESKVHTEVDCWRAETLHFY